jgi:DNA polymerase elongation subunit (family B)
MAKGDTVNQVRALMPEIQGLFCKYATMLKERRVALEDLVFTKALSKDYEEYFDRNTLGKNAIEQLAAEGRTMKGGQAICYIIVDYRKEAKKRTLPVELINDKTTYDARRYIELLAEVGNAVTEPFGYRLSTSVATLELT